MYTFLADILLIGHALIAAFVVFGLMLVIAGKFACWQWVRNRWFRTVHLCAISIVVLQASLGRICPLTEWEMVLRNKAGGTIYAGSFIAHWLHEILYYHAPPGVFLLIYSLFGLVVFLSWLWVPPEPFHR